MTVSSSTDRATFPGNGVATAFSLPFRFFANSDVVAQAIVDATGVATPLTLGIDYLLSGAGQPEEAGAATGVLTTLAPLPEEVSLFVRRVIPATQPTDIVNQGRFFPEVHEIVFDRLTMLVQQNEGALSRALRVQDFDPVPNRLPSAAQRANRILSFDVNGEPVAIDAAADSSLALRQDLAAADGATMVGRGDSTVDADLTAAENSADASAALLSAITATTLAPSLPAITAAPKLIMRDPGSTGPFYMVSKKANGKSGWVGVYVENLVSPADAENTGGASNFRPTLVLNLVRAFQGKTKAFAKSSGVVLSGLAASQVDQIWGYSLGGGSVALATTSDTADFNFASRALYSLPAAGDHVTYLVNRRRASIRIGMTNGSSTVVKIQVSSNGTDFFDYQTTTAKMPTSGVTVGRSIPVEFSGSAPWYLRVRNETVELAPVYVAGLNIGPLSDTADDIDTAAIVQAAAISGVPNQYQGGGGANEFAAKPISAPWFGTYHGGHSAFLQRLRTDVASYNLDSSVVPTLAVTTSAQLHSTSTLTSGGTVYQYTAETAFGDGAHITHYGLELVSGPAILCTNVYTHMCTTQRDFNYIHVPKLLKKEDDGNVPVGNCSFIQQFKASDGIQLNTYFSRFLDVNQNGLGGAYVSFQPNYNKQYYGPAVFSVSGYPLNSFAAVTAKEYF